MIAGSSIILMAIVAGFSYGYAHKQLISTIDPEYIGEKLGLTQSLLISEVWGWIIVFFCDLLAAWCLYHYFKDVDGKISKVTAIIRLIYTIILGWAICHIIDIFPLLSNVNDSGKIQITEITKHINQFEEIWSGGLMIFGMHLLGLGYLSYLSQVVPRIWGILLIFAGLCYSSLHLAKATLHGYDQLLVNIEMILSLPMAISEIGLAFWLIIKGRKAMI